MTASPSLNSLQGVYDHAADQRDLALAELGRATDALQRLGQQNDQLIAYRGQHRQRWAEQFKHRAPIEMVNHYRAFTVRLDQALDQLAAQLAQAQAQLNAARATLLEREQRLATVAKLIERRLAAHGQHIARASQRNADEAGMAAWRRRERQAAAEPF